MTTNTAIHDEGEDLHVKMLDSFLSCPHRNTEEINKVHGELQKVDPLFYAHLAAWYQKHGDIRDHKEVFAARLMIDEHLPNRDVGIALWQRHPFFMKDRIIGFLKGKDVKIREKTDDTITRTRRGKKVEIKKSVVTSKHVGLDKNIPRRFREEIKKYLRWLEDNPQVFDSVVARNAKELKSLYFTMRMNQYTDRANKILFNREYPKDSKLSVFEEIANEKDPLKQAEMIIKERVPFMTAVGMIDNPTPASWIALLDVMSPQEAINHVAVFEEHGLMDNPETKELILKKLKKAEKSKNVSALKSQVAKKTGRIKDEDVSKQLDNISDTQIKKSGTIKSNIALCIDKSGSMQRAIEVGCSVAALISGATEGDLTVLAHDSRAYPVMSEGSNMSDWKRAFSVLRAHGRTAHGACMDYLIKRNKKVDTIVLVTDEGESEYPTFSSKYAEYKEKFGISPFVVIIRVDLQVPRLSQRLSQAQIEHDIYVPDNNDYYALPGLIPMLSRSSKTDLVYEIMETPLPRKKGYN